MGPTNQLGNSGNTVGSGLAACSRTGVEVGGKKLRLACAHEQKSWSCLCCGINVEKFGGGPIQAHSFGSERGEDQNDDLLPWLDLHSSVSPGARASSDGPGPETLQSHQLSGELVVGSLTHHRRQQHGVQPEIDWAKLAPGAPQPPQVHPVGFPACVPSIVHPVDGCPLGSHLVARQGHILQPGMSWRNTHSCI